MEILRIDAEHPDRPTLDHAAEAVMRGGVIAFPTDTLYGLGCSLFDVSAVEMIARLKRRPPSHAVISLIPDPEQAWGLALTVSPIAERLMRQCWPGPLSLIFSASGLVPAGVQGGGTIALRCPRDPLSNALLHRIGGPVVSSSANLSGEPPAETADDVVRYFANQLDLILDGVRVAGSALDTRGPEWPETETPSAWGARCDALAGGVRRSFGATPQRLTPSKPRTYPAHTCRQCRHPSACCSSARETPAAARSRLLRW